MHRIYSIFIFIALLLAGFAYNTRKLKCDNESITETVFCLSSSNTFTEKLFGEIKFVKKLDKEYGEIPYAQIKRKERDVISSCIIPIDNVKLCTE